MRIEIGSDSAPNDPKRSVGRKIQHSMSQVPKVYCGAQTRLRQQLFPDPIPKETGNHSQVTCQALDLCDDTYWPNCQWFYDVYAPLDKHYAKNPEWFESKKWLDFVRKRYKNTWSLIITKEKDAAKHHINVLYSVPDGVPPKIPESNVIDGKCYVKRQWVTTHDQSYVMLYIFKEAKTRTFILYEDYYLHQRQPLAPSPQDEQYDQPMPENEPYPVWMSIPCRGHLEDSD